MLSPAAGRLPKFRYHEITGPPLRVCYKAKNESSYSRRRCLLISPSSTLRAVHELETSAKWKRNTWGRNEKWLLTALEYRRPTSNSGPCPPPPSHTEPLRRRERSPRFKYVLHLLRRGAMDKKIEGKAILPQFLVCGVA